MKKEFWLEKWENKQTGFHKDEVHPLLIKYIDDLKLKHGDTVFVPLCGKTLDMLWLNSQGYKVIGIELSELAILGFFTENDIAYEKSTGDFFDTYTYENITIYKGDFFELTQAHCQSVNVVYDRAALIALPDDLVVKYVNKMHDIIPKMTMELLITLEFDRTSGSDGPPFNTSHEKVKKLLENYKSVEQIYITDIIERESSFQKQGCTYVNERAYLITN
jgi:thiopurine S-methyltransferase